MSHLHSPTALELENQILLAARGLFARKGYDSTTTRDLATAAGVAEATLFRHFANKKAILIAIVIQGWAEILTDLLTELSSISNYKSMAQLLYRRMINLHENADMMRICFLEAQVHPELRDRLQSEIINKMIDVTEAFFETAIQKGVYRPMNPKIVAQVFLGMFAIAGFSYNTLLEPNASPQEMKEMAEGLADIFLNGVLAKE
ncbi:MULTISPECIES: TetR/AcrR family transcriptional regulator [Planktothrix]|jgi:AcrR family transcriptional regulator|uniref:TetR family transcriptional regulator n=2 Tax=Planktothrix TaxID=54304 RepID=A0A479ZPZ4_PLAAG|nr:MULTISPECIES: TetR/AcrR family transcriptional regulator [Planktothrix]CAD5909652.1 Regulatory protein TetR [Planktothrix rubescens]CAC5345283.1 Regulatory protein TetR [Planktothrix rubescens NIVA-CYA 18]CAD5961349.1 Regulatory protein TetR [Planktothrix rubescens NIVA-CYA 18]CAH2573692.1 Regulatory protein TetR [Planktothrix rubescens]GCL34760.1 TetR family transcriptional regulator [Planktothrix agardhii CCAP 1459/11A]